MRMWMIDPKLLCTQHLVGEHGEIHKHRHNFVKKHSIDGRIDPIVFIEPQNMQQRHDELAAEMQRRGMKHQSPYQQPDLSYLSQAQREARVNQHESFRVLMHRCQKCSERMRSTFTEA